MQELLNLEEVHQGGREAQGSDGPLSLGLRGLSIEKEAEETLHLLLDVLEVARSQQLCQNVGSHIFGHLVAALCAHQIAIDFITSAQYCLSRSIMSSLFVLVDFCSAVRIPSLSLSSTNIALPEGTFDHAVEEQDEVLDKFGIRDDVADDVTDGVDVAFKLLLGSAVLVGEELALVLDFHGHELCRRGNRLLLQSLQAYP